MGRTHYATLGSKFLTPSQDFIKLDRIASLAIGQAPILTCRITSGSCNLAHANRSLTTRASH
jgi:hypothetical protein